MSGEYYSVLARTISAASEDHTRLRGMVYRLARIELRKELYRRYRIELRKQTSALEDAIAKIETDFTNNPALSDLSSKDKVDRSRDATPAARTAVTIWKSDRNQARSDGDDCEVLSPIVEPSPYPDWLPPNTIDQHRSPPKAVGWGSRFWWPVQVGAVAMLGVLIYFAGELRGEFSDMIARYGHFERVDGNHASANMEQAAASQIKPPAVAPMIDGAPLPTSYGVYAIDQGKLVNLQPLPLRVPDPRIAISAMISTPSQTTLPGGPVEFVIFRRDLVNNAPDHASVRVIARVMRILTFSPGRPAKTVDIDGKWAIRGKAYPMSVSPVPGSPEMILIRPDKPDFSFPAGRYALVLDRGGYDFTITGQITDVAQCLEQTDTADESLYSECRKL
jgi:hypothetical protein